MLRNGLNCNPQMKMDEREYIRRLKDEAEVLQRQKEELKRLKWLDKAINNSHGLKNRHLQGYLHPVEPRKRSKSTAKSK